MTRNDDHGGDPLKRLQALVNTFDAQCRRTGLDAEIVVVEWNPPADRPRLHALLRVPEPCAFVLRFVEVPATLHDSIRHADVLPLFQMIAKNVGIRRARGRFVLSTNIDIIFSNELVEYLASGRLAPGYHYRVDRHDIEPDFPVDSALEDQIAYCRTHQLRVHTRLGTQPVDHVGRMKVLEPDVTDSPAITLVSGWHVREGDAVYGFHRWAMPEARFALDRTTAENLTSGVVLDIDVEPHPYQPNAWVELEILDGDRRRAHHMVSRRETLRVALDDGVARHDILLKVLDSSGGRDALPLFERRRDLCYRVHHLRVGHLDPPAGGVDVTTDARQHVRSWLAAVADPPLHVLRQWKSRISLFQPRRARRKFESRNVDESARVGDLDARLQAQRPSELAGIEHLLREHRPPDLHLNASGDFQLLAREHWLDLRGFAEFAMYSMNIDGLFEVVAEAAGIEERVLAMPLCIYHLEHEKGSGWTPEGEALLRRRIAASGIRWLDATAVHMWSAYMAWLERPMIFNDSRWGFGDHVLPETTRSEIPRSV